jgi:hypothetical protein
VSFGETLDDVPQTCPYNLVLREAHPSLYVLLGDHISRERLEEIVGRITVLFAVSVKGKSSSSGFGGFQASNAQKLRPSSLPTDLMRLSGSSGKSFPNDFLAVATRKDQNSKSRDNEHLEWGGAAGKLFSVHTEGVCR